MLRQRLPVNNETEGTLLIDFLQSFHSKIVNGAWNYSHSPVNSTVKPFLSSDLQEWIAGLAHNLGSSGVLMAKLWYILGAVQIVWQKVIKKIWIEGDHMSAINLRILRWWSKPSRIIEDG
ncbi:hypothetical protein VNO77_24006 [Canavalia gladiata]|uniref:Uncharacterized protein n=1 Tax=Canavalia gladiata TaxID=3824 RepID=A0AAN9QC29_CANGL